MSAQKFHPHTPEWRYHQLEVARTHLEQADAPSEILESVTKEIERRRHELKQTVVSILEIFTPHERGVFGALTAKPNQVVTYDEVRFALDPTKQRLITQHSLATYVDHINRKTPGHLGRIEREPRVGYKWIPFVPYVEVQEGAAPQQLATPVL